MLRRLFSAVKLPEQLSSCLNQLQSKNLYELNNQDQLCNALRQASIQLKHNRGLRLDLSSHPSAGLIAAQAAGYSPDTLYQCVLYLAAGNIRIAHVWTSVQPGLLKAFSSLSPFSIAVIAIAYSNSGVTDSKLWLELEQAVISSVLPAQVIYAEMLMQLWYSFEKSPLNMRKGLLEALESEVQRLLNQLKPWQVAYIAREYLAQQTGSDPLIQAMDSRIGQECLGIEAKLLFSLLSHRLKRHPLPVSLLSKLESAILPTFPALVNQPIKLITLYALEAPTHTPSRAFLEAWTRLIERNYERLLPKEGHKDLLDLMWSLSVLRITQSPRLLTRLLEDLRTRDVPGIEEQITKLNTIREFYEQVDLA
jgi:hypothetical protein